jgi:hypothetical protein
MAVNTRPQLIDYCLRRLGAPVTEINVDDEQISDRIDDAIEFFQEYHFDGVEKVFLKHKITAQNIADEWIPIPQDVLSVLRILPIPNFSAFQTGMFNEEYHLRLADMDNFSTSSLINWSMQLTNYSLITHLFSIQPTMMYNRKQDRLYLETDWETKFNVDSHIIVEAYRQLDPTTWPQVYNDMFLKKYATALIKQQWGSNLKKFTGVVLPGGISLDGQTIFTEATEEITKIEEEVSMKYELPPDGFIA